MTDVATGPTDRRTHLKYNKRTLVTASLAVVATVVFGAFMYRVAEWSSGTNGKTAGLTQTALNCSEAGSNRLETTKVIPQMAFGSFDGGLTTYSTAIQIVNISGNAQGLAATFYKEDGTPLNNVTLAVGPSTLTNGVFRAVSIVKDGVLVVAGGGKEASGVIGWGKITSCGALSLSTFFELRDAKTNVLLSRVGVPASQPNMSNFVIPRIREVGTGLDVGFALVNTAASGSATVRAELKDAEGNTIATKDIRMAGGVHQSGFTKDLFAPLNEPKDGRTYQYVKFSSNSPTIAAIALAFEGSTQTSLPAEILQ
jgi:hypothetical protein